jgi:hypothetical protein
MNKSLAIILIAFGFFRMQAQAPDPALDAAPYTIINNGMAVSVATALYPPGFGLNLGKMPGADAFKQPEFLVSAYFNMIKTADMQGIVALYDPESQDLIRERLDIKTANREFQSYDDFELFSKNSFGDLYRIRFNFINRKSKDMFPWVLMIRKIGERYYLTETIPLEHLFISASSAHPYNLSREPFKRPNLSGFQVFSFAQDGLNLQKSNPQPDNSTDRITVYLKLEAYDSAAISKQMPEEIMLLENMKKALVARDSAAFINLWGPEEQAVMATETFRTDIEVNRAFYEKISALKPLGFLKAGDETVLFFRSRINAQLLPLQMMAMKNINGRYKLRTSLDQEKQALYYAWEILNNEAVKKEIEAYFKGN